VGASGWNVVWCSTFDSDGGSSGASVRGPQALVNGHRLAVRYTVVRWLVPRCTDNRFATSLVVPRWHAVADSTGLLRSDCAFDVPWPFVPHLPTERQRFAAALQVQWRFTATPARPLPRPARFARVFTERMTASCLAVLSGSALGSIACDFGIVTTSHAHSRRPVSARSLRCGLRSFLTAPSLRSVATTRRIGRRHRCAGLPCPIRRAASCHRA